MAQSHSRFVGIGLAQAVAARGLAQPMEAAAMPGEGALRKLMEAVLALARKPRQAESLAAVRQPVAAPGAASEPPRAASRASTDPSRPSVSHTRITQIPFVHAQALQNDEQDKWQHKHAVLFSE